MRTYSAMTGRMAEEMGAIPTNVVFSEIPQAFSTGLVSTMYTSPATGVDTQAWDYTKYFVNVGGNFTMNVIIANERSFRRLDAATQKVVTDAAAEAETRGWKMSQDVTAEHLKLMADKGMQIGEPDAKFRRRARADRQGPDGGVAEEGRCSRRGDHRRLSQAIRGHDITHGAARPTRARRRRGGGDNAQGAGSALPGLRRARGHLPRADRGVILYQVFGRNFGYGIPGVDDLAALFLVARRSCRSPTRSAPAAISA